MAVGLKPYTLIDGAKSIPLNSLPAEAWTTIAGEDAPSQELDKLYHAVGILFACVNKRAAALSSMPWGIYRNDNLIWGHEDENPPPEMQFIDDLPDLLWRTEAGLCLRSELFWVKEGNGRRLQDVRWLTPWTVKPVWDKAEGLVGFKRRLGAEEIPLSVDEMVYICRPGQHETEPGKSPAEVAMTAAKVLYNADKFAALFFERGAIKATLLTVPPEAPQSERDKLKAWWRRFMSGIRNAWDAGVISAAVEPVVVGEGLAELQNTELDNNKSQSIATTLEVPHSLLFSNAANYATSQQDEQNFYNLTIIPESRLIARAVNRQLLNPLGYSLRFDPNSMTLFQEDENERAAAFNQYVSSGLRPSIVAQILGLDLPEGITLEMLDPEKPEPQPVIVQAAPDDDDDDEMQQEMRRFRNWAKKRMDREDFDMMDFESELISTGHKVLILADMRGDRQGDADGDDAPFPAWEHYP